MAHSFQRWDTMQADSRAGYLFDGSARMAMRSSGGSRNAEVTGWRTASGSMVSCQHVELSS